MGKHSLEKTPFFVSEKWSFAELYRIIKFSVKIFKGICEN
jgi:hypothetical protein